MHPFAAPLFQALTLKACVEKPPANFILCEINLDPAKHGVLQDGVYGLRGFKEVHNLPKSLRQTHRLSHGPAPAPELPQRPAGYCFGRICRRPLGPSFGASKTVSFDEL